MTVRIKVWPSRVYRRTNSPSAFGSCNLVNVQDDADEDTIRVERWFFSISLPPIPEASLNSILVYTYPLSAVLIFTLAIGVGLFLTRKFHLSWRLYWIGGAIFILSQVFHLPFNFLLLNPFFFYKLPDTPPAPSLPPPTPFTL